MNWSLAKHLRQYNCQALNDHQALKLVQLTFDEVPHSEIYEAQQVVVQNESIEFAVTLANPFSFALELTHLALRYAQSLASFQGLLSIF